jgi:hypothetical protein
MPITVLIAEHQDGSFARDQSVLDTLDDVIRRSPDIPLILVRVGKKHFTLKPGQCHFQFRNSRQLVDPVVERTVFGPCFSWTRWKSIVAVCFSLVPPLGKTVARVAIALVASLIEQVLRFMPSDTHRFNSLGTA